MTRVIKSASCLECGGEAQIRDEGGNHVLECLDCGHRDTEGVYA